jgi:hypothetical protein
MTRVSSVVSFVSLTHYFSMDSSSSSLPDRSSQLKTYSWASIVGTAIALLTLTIPPTIITYYSSNNALDTLLQTAPPLTRSGK